MEKNFFSTLDFKTNQQIILNKFSTLLDAKDKSNYQYSIKLVDW